MDPRDFKITGDASPATMYHPTASAFFSRNKIRSIILLRHPVLRSVSDFHNKIENPRWVLNCQTIDELVNKTVVPDVRDAYTLLTCQTNYCVSPVIWQSWYDVFLINWMEQQPLVLFSDDFYNNTNASMRKVTQFLNIEDFAFDTSNVYNNNAKRGVRAIQGISKRSAQHTCESQHVLRKLQSLMQESVRETDMLLQRFGYPGVPIGWNVAPLNC